MTPLMIVCGMLITAAIMAICISCYSFATITCRRSNIISRPRFSGSRSMIKPSSSCSHTSGCPLHPWNCQRHRSYGSHYRYLYFMLYFGYHIICSWHCQKFAQPVNPVNLVILLMIAHEHLFKYSRSLQWLFMHLTISCQLFNFNNCYLE